MIHDYPKLKRTHSNKLWCVQGWVGRPFTSPIHPRTDWKLWATSWARRSRLFLPMFAIWLNNLGIQFFIVWTFIVLIIQVNAKNGLTITWGRHGGIHQASVPKTKNFFQFASGICSRCLGGIWLAWLLAGLLSECRWVGDFGGPLARRKPWAIPCDHGLGSERSKAFRDQNWKLNATANWVGWQHKRWFRWCSVSCRHQISNHII